MAFAHSNQLVGFQSLNKSKLGSRPIRPAGPAQSPANI